MSAALAALPMYDLPELRWATDALWAGIAAHARAQGIEDVPASLARDRPVAQVYGDPNLLFAQACGYDITHDFAGRLRVVATPSYAAPGAEGPCYRSVFVVRAGLEAGVVADLAGRVCAINGWGSHSGMNVLRAAVAPFHRDGRFFARVLVSGSHAASLALVAAGAADVAAIDCVSYALIARHRPAALAGTRVLGFSERAPGLPFVTRGDADEGLLSRLRAALAAALADPALAQARAALLLNGIAVLAEGAYEAILACERRAIAAGYPRLA